MHSSRGFVLLDQEKYNAISTLQMAYVSGEKYWNRKKNLQKRNGTSDFRTEICGLKFGKTIDLRLDRCPIEKIAPFSYRHRFIKSSVCLLYFSAPRASVPAINHRERNFTTRVPPSRRDV